MMFELAPYASHPATGRGRRYSQSPAPTRNDYQRDRDRIVHSSAFRRLVYKTQVFLNHEGDLFRTRLTHSLEVAQLGRSISRSLGLHEDLVEAIALAHDLGHTPFGHAGQDELNACMKPYGGFEHNLQSLRIVDQLELRYADFDGLNLCFETREGILKHCSGANAQHLERKEPGGVAARFLKKTQASLEAQLCNLADEIAYNAHDLDDGVRSGLITLEQAREVVLVDQAATQVLTKYPHLHGRRLLYELIRLMLSEQVFDVIGASKGRLETTQPQDAWAARQLPVQIGFSEAMSLASTQLKQFLFRNLYRHPQVVETTQRATHIVRELFEIYLDSPMQMSEDFSGQGEWPRPVADYIAGMTDRFAIREHTRLTGKQLF